MKKRNTLHLFSFILAITFLMLILLGALRFGKPYLQLLLNLILSNAVFILLIALIAAVLTLAISFYFMSNAEPTIEKKESYTKLSALYLNESMEGKSKKDILRDLEDRGYKKSEIASFLKEWEKREERK